MSFTTLSFLIFLPIIFILYLICPPKLRFVLLAVASIFACGFGHVTAIIPAFIVTAVSYLCGYALAKNTNKKTAKPILAVGIILCLIQLCLYKYVFKNAAFPVGLSFYTFAAIGLMADIYTGKCKALKNPLKHGLFIFYFPMLSSGPIQRGDKFFKQIEELPAQKAFDVNRILSGSLTALYGLFMKLVIADRLKLYVDTIFDPEKYSLYSGIPVILGFIFFSLEIYTDFSGYTCIALGISKIFGIELSPNFKNPYLAGSIKEVSDIW
ncbi:MAG: hypothetical protein K6F84_03005, partial [Lachnospiraceae bacterium]|nr:hypothetical protein [Lachnospiraceae bacterium]